jgi:hypothetical protein
MTVYKVKFEERDSWSPQDNCTYTKTYPTEAEARKAYQDIWDRYMGRASAPEFYIRPTYLGTFEE